MSLVCRACKAPIVWAKMPSGKANPLDVDPSARGNVRLEPEVPGQPRQGVALGKHDAESARLSGERLYLSHFVTCEHAAAFKR